MGGETDTQLCMTQPPRHKVLPGGKTGLRRLILC